MVDLKGQLSNPRESLETLDSQGSQASRQAQKGRHTGSQRSARGPREDADEEVGRYSNPPSSSPTRRVQRRLTPDEVDDILEAYVNGEPIRDIAFRHGVHRTTVLGHVTRRGLPRRSDQAWTDQELQTAARLYASGKSLATVGQHFGIDAATVANRFRRAGVPIRARRGWA
mgnify:FL=1